MKEFLKYLSDTRDDFDRTLSFSLSDKNELLTGLEESVNYSLFSKGKRIRPVFCFLVGELFNVPREKLKSVACALEMIHTSSLILDDLPCMDDSKMRRGQPANHLVHGQDVALLSSIGLLTEAYKIVADDVELADEEKLEAIRLLANTVGFGGMVAGQYVDLKFSDKNARSEVMEFIHNHKTASLFVSAASIAAHIGKASDPEKEAVESYARNLGFAFQVLDDILDFKGSQEEVRKSVGLDKGNVVYLSGIERAMELVEEHTRKAFESIEIFNNRNEKLLLLGKILLNRKT